MSFSEGDTVQLKSGGPMMTVDHIHEGANGKKTVHCIWIELVNKRREKRTESFPEHVLVKGSVGAVGIRIG